MYDRSTDLWQMLFHICSGLTIHSKHFWSQFFGAQMRFYRQMLMASKVTYNPCRTQLGLQISLGLHV